MRLWKVLAAGFFILATSDRLLQAWPAPDERNIWYRYTDSNTVIVFIHGFLSNSRDAWLYQRDLAYAYWPDLIAGDRRPLINNVSIFLAGYYTALDSGDYGIRDAADEVFRALNRIDPDNNNLPAMEKQNIIFVAHSLGGVVARYLLESNYSSFAHKNVGLVLIASPSFGSEDADRLAWLTEYFHQTQGRELQWGGDFLKDLDSRFKRMLNDRRIDHIEGVEGVEHHFIFAGRWWRLWYDREVVVTAESAARYFGPGEILAGTDHISSAKPISRRHPSYNLLYDFMAGKFSRYLISQSTGSDQLAVAAISGAARAGIDWCRVDRGEPGCAWEDRVSDTDCLRSGGGRSCLTNKAIQAARQQQCDEAFGLIKMCLCRDDVALRAVIDAGEPAVCGYLAHSSFEIAGR